MKESKLDETKLKVEVALVTARKIGLDLPPPGVGFFTVTTAVRATATSVLEMLAVSCELVTNVVVFALPFQFTVDPVTKPVPFTVNVKLGPPGATVAGTNG